MEGVIVRNNLPSLIASFISLKNKLVRVNISDLNYLEKLCLEEI